ncbi:hypothetical protein XA68_18422 [Ophiocordyceps unilateralis]|uniref:N-acetyltransferase domain-containing protein n=1 Tax=Ophiocordyceps unilateralis TaxID=268505 RepID=A0A2A9PIG2_OPHUN|nr:hypothetical protein XA68_18422 [Ophiocordyceps unilateralis]
MRLNENTTVSTSKILLVPYQEHHVPEYHNWMQDPSILEATASEPLTLEEEFANQAEWRAAGDKLTFILCEPGGRPMGDVNLFLQPALEEEAHLFRLEGGEMSEGANVLTGEVDVMIASSTHRGKGTRCWTSIVTSTTTTATKSTGKG